MIYPHIKTDDSHCRYSTIYRGKLFCAKQQAMATLKTHTERTMFHVNWTTIFREQHNHTVLRLLGEQRVGQVLGQRGLVEHPHAAAHKVRDLRPVWRRQALGAFLYKQRWTSALCGPGNTQKGHNMDEINHEFPDNPGQMKQFKRFRAISFRASESDTKNARYEIIKAYTCNMFINGRHTRGREKRKRDWAQMSMIELNSDPTGTWTQ